MPKSHSVNTHSVEPLPGMLWYLPTFVLIAGFASAICMTLVDLYPATQHIATLLMSAAAVTSVYAAYRWWRYQPASIIFFGAWSAGCLGLAIMSL